MGCVSIIRSHVRSRTNIHIQFYRCERMAPYSEEMQTGGLVIINDLFILNDIQVSIIFRYDSISVCVGVWFSLLFFYSVIRCDLNRLAYSSSSHLSCFPSFSSIASIHLMIIIQFYLNFELNM